jgi:hypothetical protein
MALCAAQPTDVVMYPLVFLILLGGWFAWYCCGTVGEARWEWSQPSVCGLAHFDFVLERCCWLVADVKTRATKTVVIDSCSSIEPGSPCP